jgi:hypothetical protein
VKASPLIRRNNNREFPELKPLHALAAKLWERDLLAAHNVLCRKRPGDGVLNSAFVPVAISTQHLTIFRNSPAAQTPRGYMVGLHTVKGEMLFAGGANAFLPFVCRPRHFRGKGAYA